MELRDEFTRGLVLNFPAHILGHQQDADGSKQVDETGDLANAGIIVFEDFQKDGRAGHGEGCEDAAEIEADTSPGGTHTRDKQFRQEQRQPAEINAAEKAQYTEPKKEA